MYETPVEAAERLERVLDALAETVSNGQWRRRRDDDINLDCNRIASAVNCSGGHVNAPMCPSPAR